MNIMHALLWMLVKNIEDSFKVPYNPTLTGWNPTMSIHLIVAHQEVSYGKPKGNTLWDNVKLFKLAFLPTDTPKMLFHCIKQLQEIALIAQNPYTQAQLITNTMHLLLQLSILKIGRW
jgi:hypothetical protein